jgi:hypothetical protein
MYTQKEVAIQISKQKWFIQRRGGTIASPFGSHLGWKSVSPDTILEGPFHQSLVAIGPVVSDEKIKM